MSDSDIDTTDEHTLPRDASVEVPLSFAEEDETKPTTTKRHIFVLPVNMRDALSRLSAQLIRHPRYLVPQLVLCAPDGTMGAVQEQRRAQGSTWFIGNNVEPRSPLSVVTRLDPSFLALHLLYGTSRSTPTTFCDLHDIMGRDEFLCLLSPMCLSRVAAAVLKLSENRTSGDNETFYRPSPSSIEALLRSKHQVIINCLASTGMLSMSSGSTWESDLTDTSSIQAASLVGEWIPVAVEPLLTAATGVNLEEQRKKRAVARSGFNHSSSHTTAPTKTEESSEADKKKVIDSKSLSVKKLEKAGAPKGTPTLMSMFSKK